MMKFVYYVVRPKRELLDLGKSWDDDIEGALLFPQIFRSRECDYRIWRPDDYAMKVKFIAILEMWDLLPSPELFEQVLPGAKVDAETFDRWWTLDRITSTTNVHDIEEGLPEALIKTVQPTGNVHIDEWLEHLKVAPAGKRVHPPVLDRDDEE